MTETKVWTFFYGSYMNLDVLKELNLIPDEYDVAILRGFEIKIQPPLGYITLKNHGTLEEVEIDGVKHQVLKFKDSNTFTTHQYVGRGDVFINAGAINIKVVELLLNGFIATSDDKITYEIIIFDPRY